MPSEPLIPIYGVINRTRERREIDKYKIDTWYESHYNNIDLPMEHKVRHLLVWIDRMTTGRFFLEPTIVAFKDEADFVKFKLWYQENK